MGARNTRYFLLYLLSVCGMALAIGLLTADMLLHAVLRSGLLRASYVDERGQQQPAGPLFIVQVPTSSASEPNWVHGAKDHDPSPCSSSICS